MGRSHVTTPLPTNRRLRALLREAPDHYELLDRRLVGQLAGVLLLVVALLAALLLLAEPPTAYLHGLDGWAPAAALVASAGVAGVAMLRTERPLSEPLLLAIAVAGPVLLATLGWLSGPTSTFDALMALTVMWAGVVLPGPRLVAVAAWATGLGALPLLSGAWAHALLDRKLENLAFLWVLTGACLVWATRVRDIRRELREQRAAADALARVDPLTGLGNRRALDEALAAQIALAGRTQRPLAALVGDLDGFKAINDAHGHQVGDRVLRDVAAVLRDEVRRPDACFRWGGDEFVILLPEVDEHTAGDVAGRVSAAVADRCCAPGGTSIRLPLGVAALAEGGTGLQLLADADAALLAAKTGARR